MSAIVSVFAVLFSSLVAWGQDPARKGQESPEERIRREIQDRYKKLLKQEEKLVSIDVQNATIEQVLDRFRDQTGISFDLDPRNIPEDYRVAVFRVKNVPFREALDAFLIKSDLVIVEETPALIRVGRPARVSFNFKDTDLVTVIDMIARLSNANIIVAPEVIKAKPPVAVSVSNVPWNEVLDAVVKSSGFTTVREKYDLIRVIDPAELLKQMETRAFRLKYIQPPPTYRPKVEEGQFIHGKPPQVQQQFEQRIKEFILQRVLETVLTRNAAGKVIGNLNFDWGSNTFIVRDTKPVLDRVGELLKLIDVEPPQVLIDLKFVSTTNEDLLTFGMNYSLGSGEEGITTSVRPIAPSFFAGPSTASDTERIGPRTEALLGDVTRLPFGAGHESSLGGSHFFLTKYDMTATFRAFKRDKFTKLLQEPTLAVLDNQEATIFVGEEIRYPEITASVTSLGTLETSIKEAAKSPVKVGFQLYVLPKIVPESNKVILTLIPTNEFLSGNSAKATIAGFENFSITSEGATNSIDLPRISTATLVTKIILESGRTAVLGGLVIERVTFEDKGIPILKDIPLLSYLFKQRNDSVRKEHLLIFVTPRIVHAGRGQEDAVEAQLKSRDDRIRREFEDFRKKRAREDLDRRTEERRKAEEERFKKLKTP